MTRHTHNDLFCVSDCPRCKAVRAVLERYKFNPDLFNMDDQVWKLAEHAVDLEEASIKYREEHAPAYVVSGTTSGEISIKNVEFHVDNFVRCVQAQYRAYLLSDAQLEEVLKTTTYNEEYSLEVYLDGFVCEKKENKTDVWDVVSGETHEVKGHSDFLARAVRVAFRRPKAFSDFLFAIDTFFGSQYHVAGFVNNKFKWAVRNIACTRYEIIEVKDWVYLVNPEFQAAGIVDRRDTCLEGAQGKRVVGSSNPELLAEEKR